MLSQSLEPSALCALAAGYKKRKGCIKVRVCDQLLIKMSYKLWVLIHYVCNQLLLLQDT